MAPDGTGPLCPSTTSTTATPTGTVRAAALVIDAPPYHNENEGLTLQARLFGSLRAVGGPFQVWPAPPLMY